MTNTCFVVMPIGNQTIGGITLSETELRKKYDFIIKNAIQQADPTLEVIRADEELNPGSISNDIFTKLMHSKYVIADITYPNPNVFYELGIRHAISPRTILIKEKIDLTVPFDISHLRYIEYTQEPGSMEALKEQLKTRFKFYDANPDKPDNQFLELCAFTNYTPTLYSRSDDSKTNGAKAIAHFCFSNPDLLAAIINPDLPDDEKQQIFYQEISKNPSAMASLIQSALDI
jgi:hypothetical protein